MLYDEQNNNNHQEVDPINQPFSRSQKIMAGSLAFFAVLIVVLWSVQFKRTISGDNISNENSNVATENTAATDEEDVSALQNKDTDGDGLTDYDELNTYKTSPYLADSDSDGINDGDEIKASKDPNCPEGRDCSGSLVNEKAQVDATSQTSQSSLNNLLNQMGYSGTSTESATPGNSTQTQTTDMNALLGSQMDAATLRQLLLQQGMDKAMLDKISDKDLMSSFQEILKK